MQHFFLAMKSFFLNIITKKGERNLLLFFFSPPLFSAMFFFNEGDYLLQFQLMFGHWTFANRILKGGGDSPNLP